MRSGMWVVAAALCAGVLGAPTDKFSYGNASPGEMKVLSDYFSLLGDKVRAGKQMASAPVCDLSLASMPAGKYKLHSLRSISESGHTNHAHGKQLQLRSQPQVQTSLSSTSLSAEARKTTLAAAPTAALPP